ncbi:hypothetical protein OPV22_011402 [Ensete ventricosum]|uniref:Uncharacterized protein n=1 Tax=Ensete ventricosum TaxID=4639 RepID=A0AAV8RFL4_ENSVE|nr:hypothetical protein OPV22_011402 [Ensete ventricosum]
MSSLVLPGVGLKDRVSLSLCLHGEGQEEGKEVEAARERNGFCLEGRAAEAEESSESSSIGAASSSSEKDDKEEEEVESKRKDGAFGSFDPLEDSLPIKRGLSNFFSGKSKSFASLSEAAITSAGELVKPENPFNKRRRLVMASKMRRASLVRPPLPPLLPPAPTVAEEADDDKEQQEDDTNGNDNTNTNKNKKQGAAAFRSPRSFSLSDLQHV